MKIRGYNFIREDHPSNNVQGGVCASYQNLLPRKVITVKYPQESISFKLGERIKCCKFFRFYRSPSSPKLKFIPRSIQIAILRKFLQNLMYLFFISHHTMWYYEKS